MAGNDTHHDDQSVTEIEVATSSQGRRRKFIESSTQLRTAIYNGEDHEDLTIAEREPVPEHVSRVLQKAEELLAGLGPEFDDKTASLRKPKRPKPTVSKEPKEPISPPLERRPTGSVDFATRPQIDDAMGAPTVPILEIDPDEMIEVTDATHSLPTLRASTEASPRRSQTVTELMKRRSVVNKSTDERPETTTEVAAAFPVANIQPGQADAPRQTPISQQLSQHPIAPIPLARDQANAHSYGPNHELELDSMVTLSTESPVSRKLGAYPFQPRAALESSPKRSALRSLLNSVKRLFSASSQPSSPSIKEPIAPTEPPPTKNDKH